MAIRTHRRNQQLGCGMEIQCHGTDCMTMEETKRTIIKRSEFNPKKHFLGPR
jgi:hypothetical protein